MFDIHFKNRLFSCETNRLYQDFIRGVSAVRVLIKMAPEQAFMEMEKIRLRHRLARINKRLFNAYRKLGEQGINDFGGVSDFEATVACGSERRQRMQLHYQQIEKILKDQKEVLTEIVQANAE